MKQRVLYLSHQQARSASSHENAAAAKRRVQMMIEEEKATEYIRMGLMDNPEMSPQEMIEMIDFYCEK